MIYYVSAVLLILVNAVGWAANLLALPGNWIIVAATALMALIYPAADGPGVSWMVVLIVAGLAALGELIEFAAGAAGAAKRGASRRAMFLAMVGAIVGSLIGAIVTVPVPVIGPILGAVGGGAAGAFVGAYLGETWKGKSSAESLDVGKAALIGRLLGTVGKLAVGAIMVVVVAIDALFPVFDW